MQPPLGKAPDPGIKPTTCGPWRGSTNHYTTMSPYLKASTLKWWARIWQRERCKTLLICRYHRPHHFLKGGTPSLSSSSSSGWSAVETWSQSSDPGPPTSHCRPKNRWWTTWGWKQSDTSICHRENCSSKIQKLANTKDQILHLLGHGLNGRQKDKINWK